MNYATVHSRGQLGIEAPLVNVEAHLSNGLPKLSIVGLPEAAVKESKDRVRSAIINSRFDFPARRITINLSPADLPKEGGRYDLPIALGILAASGQIPPSSLAGYEFVGELALSGKLCEITGTLPIACATQKANRKLWVPLGNLPEASLVQSLEIYVGATLLEVCEHFSGRQQQLPQRSPAVLCADEVVLDLADVKGQYQAKRALEIAACGGHNLLFFGPPGTGKSMLASRLPGILPPLSQAESLAVATLNSIRGFADISKTYGKRPFRHPHHTASAVALVGGGSHPKPGEISLAHHGVLFLDELPQFDRKVLEVMREPLEAGYVSISRASEQVQFPAQFQLIAAMNPCPCGYRGAKLRACVCSDPQVQRYLHKISGPLLDRIDLHVRFAELLSGELLRSGVQPGYSSAEVRVRVALVRELQLHRQGCLNRDLGGKMLAQRCGLSQESAQLLERAMDKLKLSARAAHRVIKVARTIADLNQAAEIESLHLSEALMFRECF